MPSARRCSKLPEHRTCDYEDTSAVVTSSGGFTLKKVFYTVPSRLVGHRLRVKLYDDRLDLLIGATLLMTLTRGRPGPNGKHGHVVDYRHVIHALRRKPMALLNLVYRDQLFPREAYRLTFERLREVSDKRRLQDAGGTAQSRARSGLRGELAAILSELLKADRLPDLAALRARFAPDPARLPQVCVELGPLERVRDAHRERSGRSGMSAAIDATRLSFILNELRLPAIKHVWPKFAERSDKEGWTAARFLARSPSTSSPSATVGASSDTWAKRSCCPARPSRTSTSRRCR
jgi:hypothetical protein